MNPECYILSLSESLDETCGMVAEQGDKNRLGDFFQAVSCVRRKFFWVFP